MDPSRYARAFGVQSESNKVTVTRVASNEIVYRRAVDTFRRDMASTMTNIHREQKKLRRNMRAYRRKLRETHNLPVKKRKPFKAGWIAYNSQTSLYDLQTDKDKNKGGAEHTPNSNENHESDMDSNQLHTSKIQGQVEMFLKSVDEHVHNLHTKRQEESEEEENNIFYDKNGRRRFLFGSGGIGVSSDALKDMEFELEGYHVDSADQFSDSSSESGGDHDSGRKISRKKRTMELLRLNSAYFTPLDIKDGEIGPSTNESVSEIAYTEKEIGSQNEGGENQKYAADVKDELAKDLPSTNSAPTMHAVGESEETNVRRQTFQNAIFSVVQKVKNKNNEKNSHGPTLTQTQQTESSNKKPSRVNFGDLIKFRHGVNTKKLFSMVDQLASRYGVTSKEHDNEQGKKPQGSVHLRTHQNIDPIHESNTKSSIFYAMKYGYGKHNGISHKDEYKRGDIHVKPGEHHRLENSNEKPHREQKEFLSPGHQATQYYTDAVDGSVMSSEHTGRRSELPFLHVSSPASLTRQSLDVRESSRSGHDPIPIHTQSLWSNDELVKRRRSSILDASNYVSNLRNRMTIQEHDKMFGPKYDADRFGPRRIPAALRKGPNISEHQRKADDNKIAWSSALGQMKLVHTLQDLTHFL